MVRSHWAGAFDCGVALQWTAFQTADIAPADGAFHPEYPRCVCLSAQDERVAHQDVCAANDAGSEEQFDPLFPNPPCHFQHDESTRNSGSFGVSLASNEAGEHSSVYEREPLHGVELGSDVEKTQRRNKGTTISRYIRLTNLSRWMFLK